MKAAAVVLIRTDWVSTESSIVLLLINSVSDIDAIHGLGDIWYQDHVLVSWGSWGAGSPIQGDVLSWATAGPPTTRVT